MDKQVYELTAQDFRDHPVWYFPMDESVEDEFTARPVIAGAEPPEDMQLVVATVFTDALGREHEGYAYPAIPKVSFAQPVMWAGGETVTFWNGPGDPSGEYLALVAGVLPANMWPIRFRTVAGVREMSGVLEGLYWLGASGREDTLCRICDVAARR